MSVRPLLAAVLGGCLSLPAFAQEAPTITVGTLINGTSGGVVVGPEAQIRARLLKVLEDNGHRAIAPTFADRDRIEAGNARFILNGNVVDQACDNQPNWSGCRWRIQWSIVDREQEAVIVEATGIGEASLPQTNPSTAMYVEIIARAALPLARSPELRALLADSGDAPPATGWNRPVGARPCPAPPRTLPADTRALQPSMFTVQSRRGRADGVLFSPDGLGLTAALPLSDSKIMTATMADGSTAGLTVLRLDDRADLALVHLAGREGACAPVSSAPVQLGAKVFGLGTRGEDGWGLRSGIVTATRALPAGKHLDTDAVLDDLSPRAPIFSGTGAWVATAPPAGTESLLAQDALARLEIIPVDTADTLQNLDRRPRRMGEAVRLELGGAVDGPLTAPMAPGRAVRPLAETPGGTEMVVGGSMLGVGALVGIPAALLWAIEESSFDATPNERLILGTATGVSAALAIGGGVLLYRGIKKSEQTEVEIVASPGRVGLRGRF